MIAITYIMLDNILNNLKDKFHLIPCTGVEIEFYLYKNQNIQHQLITIDELKSKIEIMLGIHIETEEGYNQFEINLPPTSRIFEYAQLIHNVRKEVIKYASKYGYIADFSGKPFAEDYGSAMHVHLNFIEDKECEKYANILCNFIQENIRIFIPKQKDFERLNSKFFAPTHICYGNNNRTVAIRIPDKYPKRIEHRVPSANADPLAVMYVILFSILQGLENPNNIIDFPRIFGNAYDPQYELTALKYST